LRAIPPPPEVIHSFPLDADPGWTTQGQWAFGVPQGLGGDPSSGHTGAHVYGYNLAGAYANGIPEYFLTTPALDCSGYENVTLSFRRWLGVESASYDHARVYASTNGTTWVTLWNHVSGSFQDTSWQAVSYDLSAIADDSPTVYLRWGMGSTDGSVTYSGWNIDDIELVGNLTDSLRVSPADDLRSTGYLGGPFNPSNNVYTLTNRGSTNLTWTAVCASNWISITPDSGTLSAGVTTDVTVAINANANGLGVGAYNATVAFCNGVSGMVRTRTVALTVQGDIAFDSACYTNGEAGGPALITVRRVGNTNRIVTVDFATSNGTATAGNDYVATSGTLTFAVGDTVKSFDVQVLNDALAEGNETVNLALSNPTGGGALGDPLAATLTIVDDDGFLDDFDLNIDLPQWSAFGGTVGTTVIATNHGGFVSSPNSLWFSDAGSRFAATRSLDTSDGGPMSFWLRFGYGSSPWETADLPGEGVVVESSTNGGTSWLEIGRYDTTNFYSWTYVSMAIPVAAQGPVVRFRWRQLSHSGTSFDHWALDNVMISTVPPDALTVTPTDGLSASGYSGGPFSPSNKVYTLTNTDSTNLTWTAVCASNWISVTPDSGTLSAGVTTDVTVAINANANGLGVGDYNATVAFSNDVSGVVQTRAVSVTVQGEIAFDSATYAVSETGGTAMITVRRDGNTSRAVTVDFATSNGTSMAGSDYVATNGTLTFAVGDTVKSFGVQVLNDALAEGNETVNLVLSNPTGGGTLGNPAAATLTILDDEGIDISLPRNLYDGSNYLWDIQGNGKINNGTIDAYDGGHVLLNFPSFTNGVLVSARQVMMGPSAYGTVRVTRKIYVPADRGFCRFLEVMENVGSEVVTNRVRLDTNLGSDSGTLMDSTSSGDTSFGTNDDWIVTDDADGSGDPTVAHVIANAFGQQRASAVTYSTGVLGYEYSVVLAPGETKIVMHFGAQHLNRAIARSNAASLATLEAGALQLMSPTEIAQVVNFGIPTSDSDNDGLPDWWEIQAGLSPSVSNSPGSNVDGDWMTDMEEYIADTQPTNGLSFFPTIVLTDAPTGAMSLVVYPTSAGRVYGVRWTTNLMLDPQVWTLYPPEKTGTGSAVTFTVTNDAPGRTYRTGVRLP
ncbi:MAG: Calx-beta domain-containing protein, partial [bacterium]